MSERILEAITALKNLSVLVGLILHYQKYFLTVLEEVIMCRKARKYEIDHRFPLAKWASAPLSYQSKLPFLQVKIILAPQFLLNQYFLKNF